MVHRALRPYYDHISLFLWRRRHPLGVRASVKTAPRRAIGRADQRSIETC